MLNAKLEQFAQRDLVLGWNAEERSRIENSIDSLSYWLCHKLEVIETMVFGSWTRNTILPRKYDESSDIDLMVVFNGNLYNRDPEWCRQRLRNYVASRYPKSDVRKDAPAVKLELDFIKYDLVPAIKDEWTGQYYIPSTAQYSSGWMRTSPKDLDPKLAELNVNQGGNLVRNVIRLCKYMNKSIARMSMSSYELETYLLDSISSVSFFIPKRTYDYFLEVVRGMTGHWRTIEPQRLRNILSWIDAYRTQGDKDRQVAWVQHLLPGFLP